MAGGYCPPQYFPSFYAPPTYFPRFTPGVIVTVIQPIPGGKTKRRINITQQHLVEDEELIIYVKEFLKHV